MSLWTSLWRFCLWLTPIFVSKIVCFGGKWNDALHTRSCSTFVRAGPELHIKITWLWRRVRWKRRERGRTLIDGLMICNFWLDCSVRLREAERSQHFGWVCQHLSRRERLESSFSFSWSFPKRLYHSALVNVYACVNIYLQLWIKTIPGVSERKKKKHVLQ